MSGRYSGGRTLPPGGKEPLRPGKSELAENDIDRYGKFRNRPADKLAGHQMLQNLWLRLKGFVTSRGVGDASRTRQ